MGQWGKWKVSVLRSCGVERLKPEGVYSRRPKSLLTLTSACSLLISGGPEWVSAWPSEGKVTVGEDPEWLGVIDTPWTICIKGNARSINFLVLCFRFTGLFRSPEADEWFTAIEVRQPDAARGFAWLALLSSIDAQSRWLWHP